MTWCQSAMSGIGSAAGAGSRWPPTPLESAAAMFSTASPGDIDAQPSCSAAMKSDWRVTRWRKTSSSASTTRRRTFSAPRRFDSISSSTTRRIQVDTAREPPQSGVVACCASEAAPGRACAFCALEAAAALAAARSPSRFVLRSAASCRRFADSSLLSSSRSPRSTAPLRWMSQRRPSHCCRKCACVNVTLLSRPVPGTLWNWYMFSSLVNELKLRWRKNFGHTSLANLAGSRMTMAAPSSLQLMTAGSQTRSSVKSVRTKPATSSGGDDRGAGLCGA
mmetsp:Transcript_27150/g.91262  ORF Transcript_27150/g.91262 Transcript_27150/m.91262 type:complete len:278 (-) Transcript_27150:3-836(-)